jgi:hypothetical protein
MSSRTFFFIEEIFTIDISNFLLVLDQVVVLDNMYDMIYHNHRIIKVFLHLLFFHNIHIQYNQDNANLYQKELLKAKNKRFNTIKFQNKQTIFVNPAQYG